MAATTLRGHQGADTLTGAWGNDRSMGRNDLLGAARDVVADLGVWRDNDMLVFHAPLPPGIVL
jgi:hypothetical protein